MGMTTTESSGHTATRTMTRAEMHKLAQESTSYGYYDHGVTLSVKCPLCKHDVVAEYIYMTEVQQLRAAVLDHLIEEHQTIGG